MGNQIMGKFRKNRFQGFTENQIDYLGDKWLQIESNGVIDPNKFADQYNITHKEAIKVIKLMDFDESGKVDYYKFKVGVASFCQNPFAKTAKTIFDLYDEDRDNVLGPKEVGIFLRSVLDNLHYYRDLDEPTDQEIKESIQQYLLKWDLDRDNGLEYEEYYKMMTKDPDVLSVLFNLGLVNKDEMTIEETNYNDIDSDIEIEMERRLLPRDERVERIKNGIEHTVQAQESDEFGLEEEEVEMPWKEQAKKLEPAKKVEIDASPPNAILDLEYVYGYRCHDTRNNLKYGNKGQIVYHTAGVGIVMDSQTMTQKHFLEHNDDISCLDIYENLVLTGQVGLNPFLIVWNIDNMRMVCLFNDILKNGISNCCFSNDGKSVAGIAMDDDHTLAIYDLEQALNARKDPKNKSSALIASGKLTKQEIFDMRFIPSESGDWQIAVACMKEISICTWKNGVILAERGVWKEQQPQPVLTIGFNGGVMVTGMFNGNFLCWKKNICVNSIKAHVTPVRAMMTRSQNKGLISADKRGIIMIWDPQFNKQYEIDTKEDFSFKLSMPQKGSPNVISVYESPDGKILFGTRRSEIVEVLSYEIGQKAKAKLLMQGHYSGELWGLDVHPSQNIFYTVGEDEMLAMWDVKQKKILKSTPNQYASKTLSVSPNGKWVATGCVNGRVYIYDSSSLKKVVDPGIQEIVEPDKEIISMIKFTPNSELLCVCYKPPKSEIVFYSTKNWKRVNGIQNCKYHVFTMDFSQDNKYLMVNTSKYTIEFYDITSLSAIETSVAKDITWATWTCIYGWQVQGIWPQCSDGDDVNATDRSKDGKCLVSCDDFGKIKLFKYPCPQEKSGCIKYTGHSSYVCGVKFTSSGDNIISVGGDELSIFQWKYTFSPTRNEIPDVPEEQPIEDNNPMFEQEELDKGDMIGAVKPFLGEVLHSVPSWYKPNKARDNADVKGNLQLYHVHGFRYFYILDECRDMLGWTDKNKVVFVSAALGIEVDPKTQQQQFFNKHEEDIVSFALHPNRNIAATGQMAQAGKAKCIDIFVWDIDTKEVLANFNQFHLRAIVLLKFSPDGSLLLTVGQDDDNSLAIYDWKSNRQICTSNIDKAKVNGAAWKDNEEFVTVGNKHIKFWKINGRNVQGKMGQQQGKFDSQFSAIYAFDAVISGGGSGTVYIWKGSSSDKGVKAHEGKVCSFIFDKQKKLLYSGGMDGKVISWGYEGGQLAKKQEIINLATNPLFPPGVVAMDYNEKTQQWLFGTSGAQIFSFDPVKKQTSIVVQGHFGEELWGACAAPTGHKYVTGGGDKTVRVWDIDQKKMMCVSKPFPSEIRAVDWSNDGKFIVCGDLNGFLYLLDPNTLQVQDTAKTIFTTMPKRQSTYWIDDLKISPDCKQVAFGAHGGASHLEVWKIEYPKFGKQGTKIQVGITSALTALDWSTDSTVLIVNSGAYELKYVDVGQKKNLASSSQANTEFATWTCKLGWPVQGIFPSADYSDVNTVCRSNSKKFLATGEDTQHVVLMNYPVVVPKQKRKEYIGHSSHVMRVRFTSDDNFLITVGGNDKSVIVWKTDFGSAQGKVEQANLSELCKEEGADDIDMPEKKKKKQPPPKKKIAQDENSVFQEEETDEGDQFMACKPWMGAIKEPSAPCYVSKTDGHKPPKCELQIEYVHGYRTKDMRNNLYFLANGKVLYNAAALGIILDVDSNTQTFFDKHTDDITAIDMNPVDRMTVATGELGAKPNIFVWNAETLQVKCNFKAPLQKGIIALAFTPSGKRLVAGAIDVDHTLAVFDVSGQGAVLWSDKSGPDVVVDLRWSSEDMFVTVGVKHFKLWKYDNGKCAGKKGQFGKGASNNLSGIAINGNDTLCGGADGCVQVWKGESFVKPLASKHAQICDCITVCQDYVFTGGRDGVFFILTKSYEEIQSIKLKEKCADSVCPGVRAIYADLANSRLLVGTLGSEIYQFSWDGGAINSKTEFQVQNLMRGHFCPNLKWTNEVWGLDIFQEDPDKFVTCSDDGTVRVWSIEQRKQVKIGSTLLTADGKDEKKDLNTGDFTEQCKARVVATNPKDSGFTAGMKDGTIRVYDAELTQTKVFKQAKEWISDIKFSPDGTTCVIGSHDNALYAYKFPSWKAIGKKMSKHSSYITHFDFSRDGVNLHSTCGAYELLFWDVAQCKQLPGGASALKDEIWHTWSVTLGWPVQGIWPECADGTDINAVDRSNATIDGKSNPKTSYYLLASGDDFSQVRILRYPSLKKSSEAVVGRGHSSHVTNVRWTKDDQRILSTGGEDQCVFVWKVTKLG